MAVRRPPAARLGLLDRAAGHDDLARTGHLLIRAHPEERVAGRPAQGEHERVAGDPFPAAGRLDDDRVDVAIPFRSDDGPVVDQDLHADVPKRRRRGPSLVRGGDDDRTPPRRDAVPNAQERGAPCEEDARQVVPREDRMRFDGSRRGDHAGGFDVQHLDGTDHGHERSLVEPDRGVMFQDLRPCGRRLRRECLDPFEHALVPGRGPEPTFLDEQDARSGGRGGSRGRQPRDAASDDQQIDVYGARRLLARRPADRQTPDAGRSADRPLGEPPDEPRPDEGLGVEAHRQEAVEPIRHVEQVVLGRGPARLPDDDLPLPGVRGASAHAGDAVHVHETVRAIARHAREPAPSVVLQRPREGPDPRAVQRGCDGVARLDGDPSPLEPEDISHRTGSRPDRSGSSRCHA